MIAFSYKALAKVAKHSVSVFPLEAYGFLIGTLEMVYAALPVSKTSKWHDASDRFADLESAYEKAIILAKEYEIVVPAIYHSHSSDHLGESPITSVPLIFQDKLVYIKPVNGGELLYMSRAYHINQKGEWEECEFTKLTPKGITPKTNSKRMLAKWNKMWGTVDYGNNHETELKRLYESEDEA
jgi:hypothetical protein